MVVRTQISAQISAETRERMERYVREHGVKKAHLVESALLHYLNALEEVPEDVVVPPSLTVTRASGERILERIQNPPDPTEALKRLFPKED